MSSYRQFKHAKLITFEGEARSGKGTSCKAVYQACLKAGYSVTFIDQGQKYRVLARLATDQGVDLTDQPAISVFLKKPETRAQLLELLETIAHYDQSQIDLLLYTDEMSTGSAQFGVNELTHEIVLELLFDQVRRAADRGTEVILIDGRTMADKGRQMARQGIADFLLGFYFRCDTAIAARRTEGIFADTDKMPVEEKLRLLDGIIRISERNRQDTLRSVNPMREPGGALAFHTDEFYDDSKYVDELTRQGLAAGVISINTSYTRAVEEMTAPVVAISMRALALAERDS